MNLRRPTATQATSRPSRRHHDRLPRGASYALGALPRLLVAAAALLKRDHGEVQDRPTVICEAALCSATQVDREEGWKVESKMSGIDGARELRDTTAAEPVGVNSKSSPLAERVPRRVERTSDGTQPARSSAPKWHQSLRRLGAALVVAIAASAFGAPALAQTHCDATVANELWCTSLTVGTGTLSGNTYYGAYQIGLNDFGGYGTTSRVFGYRTARIKVDVLVHDAANLHVIINNDSGTTSADGLLGASSFSLEIGTGGTKKSFPIVNPGTASSFSYPKQGLSWSTGSTVPVKLVRASGGPLVSTAIPDQHAVAGTAFRYAFPSDTFNDIDGDALTYTATNPDGTALPTWLRFAASTRTFSGTAGATDVGTVAVKVTASDGSESISDEFNIVVRAAGLAHCNASDPLEVWCATMTAGDLAGNAPLGYDSRAGLGSLSPNQFPYKGTPYPPPEHLLPLPFIPRTILDLEERARLRIGECLGRIPEQQYDSECIQCQPRDGPHVGNAHSEGRQTHSSHVLRVKGLPLAHHRSANRALAKRPGGFQIHALPGFAALAVVGLTWSDGASMDERVNPPQRANAASPARAALVCRASP